jgi:hypothetical protein
MIFYLKNKLTDILLETQCGVMWLVITCVWWNQVASRSWKPDIEAAQGTWCYYLTAPCCCSPWIVWRMAWGPGNFISSNTSFSLSHKIPYCLAVRKFLDKHLCSDSFLSLEWTEGTEMKFMLIFHLKVSWR